MEYKDYNIIQYESSGTWLIFHEIPGHGKQVVQIAETETEAKQKVDQLISGEIIPIFYAAKEASSG